MDIMEILNELRQILAELERLSSENMGCSVADEIIEAAIHIRKAIEAA